eukprot:TRINITY_DN12463_c0_g1_i6.p1 TRINITY_DN12463_c0_g1~~TRINITY_DN12463_c0_g1_i6.p1  ORF type:complete len:326 (-),score=62.76 TRINITY_DN12463_c0_g1_i6:162-1139(-)
MNEWTSSSGSLLQHTLHTPFLQQMRGLKSWLSDCVEEYRAGVVQSLLATSLGTLPDATTSSPAVVRPSLISSPLTSPRALLASAAATWASVQSSSSSSSSSSVPPVATSPGVASPVSAAGAFAAPTTTASSAAFGGVSEGVAAVGLGGEVQLVPYQSEQPYQPLAPMPHLFPPTAGSSTDEGSEHPASGDTDSQTSDEGSGEAHTSAAHQWNHIEEVAGITSLKVQRLLPKIPQFLRALASVGSELPRNKQMRNLLSALFDEIVAPLAKFDLTVGESKFFFLTVLEIAKSLSRNSDMAVCFERYLRAVCKICIMLYMRKASSKHL